MQRPLLPSIRGPGQTHSRPHQTKKPPSPTTCPNLAPYSLYDGDIPWKIETEMCLAHPTLPATERPPKKRFLITSPHLTSLAWGLDI